ncbi:MAG: 6-phospho-3-hexuloisomerase [Candidatus Syntropharchaeales archaeon]|nr:6-phospho-3-hexuloisomerase [Candidatus Syntrophoarchaeum sp.]
MPKNLNGVTCSSFRSCIGLIKDQINETIETIDEKAVKALIDVILDADKIFVMGAGRSGLVAKAFAMRLMHLGFNVYVAGETTTPAVEKGDLVIAISGSGETLNIANMARVAKSRGVLIGSVTSVPSSTLGKLSDVILEVRGRFDRKYVGGEDYTERQIKGEYRSLTPLGTVFEVLSLVVLDAVIAELMAVIGASEEDLKARHAVLE